VVSGFPETEGNAVEVARALLQRYDGTVVWLRDRGPVPAEVRELRRHGARLVPKASVRGLWAYLRAEVVFFTHGLYGSPPPSSRKPVVNLWHGDGPKDIRPAPGVGEAVRSTHLVGSTELFTRMQAEALGVAAEGVLVTGNPRTDQLGRPPAPEALARLGIDGGFVLWMPTFRRPRPVGAVRVPGSHPRPGREAADLDRLLRGLADRGLQLVVKPHPMDADRRRTPGAVLVDDETLGRAGIPLYSLLGAASGLVTDYSSVWVDYLLVDRPVAFLVQDRESYDRSLHPPDVLDWVPGEVVGHGDAPFASFLADLDAAGALGAARRRAVRERIGLTPSTTAADDLLTALVERDVLRAAPPARGAAAARSSVTV
jgi:CDP-glycerol glycerophosphotransferase (TagB/SpsB family)